MTDGDRETWDGLPLAVRQWAGPFEVAAAADGPPGTIEAAEYRAWLRSRGWDMYGSAPTRPGLLARIRAWVLERL
jgi:hypothetical protein